MRKSWDMNTVLRSGTVLSQTGTWFFFLIVVIKDNFPPEKYCLLDQSSVLCTQFLIKESLKEVECIRRFSSLEKDNTFHNPKITTSNAALAIYQTDLPCALHSGVWSCVWMGNSRKTKILHPFLQDLDFWDNLDLRNVPYLHPLKCQESCTFLSFLQNLHALQLQTERLRAHCKPNNHYSTQFRARFLYTKTPVFLVCTFSKDEMSITEHSHR